MPFEDEISAGGVRVCPPQFSWTAEGEALCRELATLLGPLAAAIDHIGSTAVPGLPAKDCLDVMVRVEDVEDPRVLRLLAAAGYRQRPEIWNREEITWGRPYAKHVFAGRLGVRLQNIHVRQVDQPNARYALLFRDFLRANELARDAWGRFKTRLAETATALADYGQIKGPATDVLMLGAETWAAAADWDATAR